MVSTETLFCLMRTFFRPQACVHQQDRNRLHRCTSQSLVQVYVALCGAGVRVKRHTAGCVLARAPRASDLQQH